MIVSEITLYNLLKSRFGEQEAQAVVEGIKQTIKEEFENKKDVFLTKDDKVEIIEKIAQSESRITWRMFLFWIGQLASFIAIAKFIFHQ